MDLYSIVCSLALYGDMTSSYTVAHTRRQILEIIYYSDCSGKWQSIGLSFDKHVVCDQVK